MVNQWIQHVKQYADQHGCSYSEALKRAKSSYQSSSKSRSRGKGMINYDDVITADYRGLNDPRKAHLKGRGNFWEDIKPATKYLQPLGDAMMKKAIEKINGLGLKKKKENER